MKTTTECYAVIFTSLRTTTDEDGYAHAAQHMVELASRQPGFLGIETARNTDGTGVTVSYWASEAAINAWRKHAEHAEIQEQGRQQWYSAYTVTVAKVLRRHEWTAKN